MRIEPPLERYAGTYPASSDANDGLAVWTKANRTIANTDIVGWYRRAYIHFHAVALMSARREGASGIW